jgi:two-component system, OmpR family, osmolarity sensor histidine kinase EnvZ
MRLWPQSLLWRTFALVAAVLFLSLVLWLSLFALYDREPRGQQIAQQISAIVNLTRVSLVAARPEARSTVLREISESEQIQVYLAEAQEKLEPLSRSPPVARMQALVTQRLGPATKFASSRNGEAGVWVSFKIDEDDYWVRLAPERLRTPLQRQFLLWGAGALAAALLAALFLASRITRPLKALRSAAQQVGRAETFTPLREEGAAELREVTRAFNQMGADLRQQDEDRALVLAGISHDLRTPLARLRLEAEMSGSEAMRDGMVGDIEQMDAIIGQFLDYARVTREATEALESVDLSSVVASVANSYTRHTAFAERPLTTQVAPGIGVTGNAKLIERAVVNLVENALRYGVNEGDAPRISLTLFAEANDAVIEVADHGPGIPEDSLARVLQPFTRLESARTDVTGSGLGLAIVSRVVKRMGGTIALSNRKSDEGTGLKATIKLPQARGAAKA